jgi:hypothetical protein
LYWVCYPSAQAKPTAAQVRAGQNAAGSALPAGQKGNETATLTGSGTFTWTVGASGLAPSTSYKFAAITDLGNDAAVVESTAWSTLGGTIVTGAAAESVALSGTQSVQVTYVVARAESVALADSSTVASIYVVARAESVALVDSSDATTTTGPVVYPVARAESVALTDSQVVGPSAYNGTTSESIALVDSSTGTVAAAGVNTVLETVGLGDASIARGIFAVAQSESVGFSDSYVVQSVTYTVTRAETVAFVDTSTGTLPAVQTGTVSETISFFHSQDAFVGVLPVAKIGHFGEPKKEGIKEAERAMIQLEDEFILEIVLSLAVKGAIA